TLDRESLTRLQLERLRSLVGRIARGVPFYREQLSGIAPDDLDSLDALAELPFTHKKTLRDNSPFGLFAVPQKHVVRIHASSGTTGKPTVVGYTRSDMALWGEVMARTLRAGGVTEDDVGHNAYGLGLFHGGLCC